MIDLFKTLIADFHARGLPGHVVTRDLSVPLNTKKIISIIGPRRAGKTWLIYSLIQKLQKSSDRQNIVYVNFEDERINSDPKNLGLIIDAYQQMYPARILSDVYFFLDEIQVMQNWEKFVRRLADTVSPHIFLTGSSAKLLGHEIAGALRGRALTFTLFPLSFKEYLRFQAKDESPEFQTTAGRNRIEAAFDRFLLEGGYPETLSMDESLRMRTLQSYFETMIYRDVVERYAVRRPHLVKDLARRLLANNARIFSVHKYYRDLKSRGVRVTKDTLYDLIDHFTDALFIVPVGKADASAAKQAQALKKYYVNDTGLSNACLFVPAEDRGAQLETLVLLELYKQGKNIAYYSGTNECDFLVLDRGKITGAFQVCHELNENNRRREYAGLQSAMRRYGLGQALLITRRQEEEFQTDAGRILVRPAWKWSLSADILAS